MKLKIKYLPFLILLFVKINFCKGQVNLVQNPSFESYTTCPSSADQLNYTTNWISFGETPDYFNTCGTNGLTVPSNVAGYQNAYTGNAYAGFVAYCINGFARETIGAQLSQTLSIATKYFTSMKISLAEFDAVNKQYLPCNKVGVRFSTIPFSTLTPVPINNFAHIYTSAIINDTLNWITIKGSFIADSNYKYIMIGNFFDDSNTNITIRPNGIYSYFYVDDICVSTDSLICLAPTPIINKSLNENLKIFPNPVRDYIIIEPLEKSSYDISLSDILGVKIFEENIINQSKLDLSKFPNGSYFLKISSKNNIYIKKIIINH